MSQGNIRQVGANLWRGMARYRASWALRSTL